MTAVTFAGARLSLLYVAGTTLALISVGVGIALDPLLAILVVAGAAAMVALVVVRRAWLPAVALGVFIVFPVKFVDAPHDPGSLGLVNPAIVPLGVWLVRWRLGRTAVDAVRLRATRAQVGLLLGCLLAIGLSVASNQLDVLAAGWLINFGALVVLAALAVGIEERARVVVLRTWKVAGAVLGTYALGEVLVWRRNPLFDGLYTSARVPLLQVWDVYRATTSLGHPLVNGMFFGAAAVITVASLLERRTLSNALGLALSASGLAMTASRGPAVGAALGIVAVLIVAWRRSELSGAHVAAIGVLTLFVAGAIVTGVVHRLPLFARSQSQEAAAALLYRETTVRDGLRLSADRPLLGWGPGHADAQLRLSEGRRLGPGLENGWVELLVSLGLTGAGVIAFAIGSVLLRAVARADLVATGLLVSVIGSVSSFNFFDGQWPAMLLLGLAVGCALAGVRRPAEG